MGWHSARLIETTTWLLDTAPAVGLPVGGSDIVPRPVSTGRPADPGTGPKRVRRESEPAA